MEGLPFAWGVVLVVLTGCLLATCTAGLTGQNNLGVFPPAHFESFNTETSLALQTQSHVMGMNWVADEQLSFKGAGTLMGGGVQGCHTPLLS